MLRCVRLSPTITLSHATREVCVIGRPPCVRVLRPQTGMRLRVMRWGSTEPNRSAVQGPCERAVSRTRAAEVMRCYPPQAASHPHARSRRLRWCALRPGEEVRQHAIHSSAMPLAPLSMWPGQLAAMLVFHYSPTPRRQSLCCAFLTPPLPRASLAKRDYCVFAFDARGHGDSTPAAADDGYTPASFAQDLTSLITELVRRLCRLLPPRFASSFSRIPNPPVLGGSAWRS